MAASTGLANSLECPPNTEALTTKDSQIPLLYRPFDVGDLVEVSGVLGKVSSMNLLSTHIKTPDNKSVIISNNAIWGNVITNATAMNKRRVDMVFGIGYQDDIAKAQRIMEDILSSHD